MKPLELGWMILKKMPPLALWKIAHSLPPNVFYSLAKVLKRPSFPKELSRNILGYKVEHPIGIAAGFDKDASMTWLAWSMGAGFHVVGSILPDPRKGVSPKILVRLRNGSTLNRLGLPSKGVKKVASILAHQKKPPSMPIAVNIASLTPEGYGKVFEIIHPYAAWIEINISCPNVKEHATFEDPDEARKICRYLDPLKKPLLLKIPPTINKDKVLQYIDVARSCGFKGIVASNTLKIKLTNGVEAGLGGTKIFTITYNMVRILKEYSPTQFTIIAVGGIDNGFKVWKLLEQGADAIEVLSAIVQRSPLAPAIIAYELYSVLATRREG